MTGPDRRVIVGITGAPAAGKSTLAAQVVGLLEPDAVLVPMDGFHLSDAELRRQGLHDRKGAPETFDAWGYVGMLRRLRSGSEPVVYAPEFHRRLEMAEAGALPVTSSTPVVITEGNYLLLDEAPWSEIRALLDEVWFIDIDEELRMQRLVERHVDFGRPRTEAEARATGVDRENAEIVLAGRHLAELIITMAPPTPSGPCEGSEPSP